MRHRLAAVAVAAVLALSLAACTGDPWASPRTGPTAIGAPAAGFVPSAAPSPEATVAPPAGSWEGIRPPEGYRVVLLRSGDDAPARTLVDAVDAWASESRVDLRTIPADGHPIDSAVEAMGMHPDLIVSVGDELVDALVPVTASHLDQRFLVVGAELAEPTANVTSADWTGASFRGEGLGASSTHDPATFTPDRAGRALRAGVAAVLVGMTGVVIWVD